MICIKRYFALFIFTTTLLLIVIRLVGSQAYDYQTHKREHNQSNLTRSSKYTKPGKREDRIFCMITTCNKNIESRAVHVHNIWGRKCDNEFYFVGKPGTENSIATMLDVDDDYDSLPSKTFAGIKYINDNFGGEYDWIVKADDDTYIVVDNLRYFVQQNNYSRDQSFGLKFYKYFKNGYFSGGAAYVLSKSAVARVVESIRDNIKECGAKTGMEDLEMGRCLNHLGVDIVSDETQSTPFAPFDMETMVRQNYPDWFVNYRQLDKHPVAFPNIDSRIEVM